MAKFTVSILALNKMTVTARCIESVMTHSGKDFELILTNNGSADGTRDYFNRLAAQYPKLIRVVHNASNLGFQDPHTKALEMCRSPFFVLLNNDTVVPTGWLDVLGMPFKNPRVGLSGPAGNCCSLHPNFHGYRGPAFEYLEGSCLMGRTDVLRKFGLFAPYLKFAYGEDSDLSLRMRYAGYNLVRVNVAVKHVGQTTSRSVPNIRHYQEENHAALRKKWAHYLKVRRVDHPIIIKRDAAIGDVLLTTPIISALKFYRSTCEIFVETKFPQIFERNPDVVKAGHIGSIPGAQVIDLNMAYEKDPSRPIIESYAARADVPLIHRELTYNVSKDALDYANHHMVQNGKPSCVIFPGPTTWPGKNWPYDRFDAISRWLIARNWNVYLIGAVAAGNITCTKDFRHTCSIPQSGAILASSQLHIGLDSFPAHLAMSQEVPSVILFGATLPHLILSDGCAIGVHADQKAVPCVGERHRKPGSTFVHCNGKCMRAISTDMVKDAVNKLIGIS